MTSIQYPSGLCAEQRGSQEALEAQGQHRAEITTSGCSSAHGEPALLPAAAHLGVVE
jgi:hypothetical protein